MDPDSYPSFLAVLLQSIFNTPDSTVFFALFLVLVLLFLSAIMSGSEIAYFSLTNVEVASMDESEDKTDQRVAKLMRNARYLLSTILIINNLVNIGVVITSYFVTKQLFNFQDLSFNGFIVPGHIIEFLWNVMVVTFFLVLFGEATPKVYATHQKISIARSMSGIFEWLTRIAKPINFVLVESTQIIEKRLKKYNTEIDIEEIDKAIEITVEDKGAKQDARLLRSIIHFGNITVKQVMRPRTEVVAVDFELPFKELLVFIKENGYSRYPVFKDNPDNMVGVLNIKDLIEFLGEAENFEWQKLVKEPSFVPETKKIDDLLREIQENRKHLAIVVDEFGGTSGIITLEDIIEEVVGEINDEFDEATDSTVKKIDDKNFLFDGKTAMTDVSRTLEVPLDFFNQIRGEAETLAGVVLELAGRMPKNGEEWHFMNYKLTVVSVVNNRIEKIKITNEA